MTLIVKDYTPSDPDGYGIAMQLLDLVSECTEVQVVLPNKQIYTYYRD